MNKAAPLNESAAVEMEPAVLQGFWLAKNAQGVLPCLCFVPILHLNESLYLSTEKMPIADNFTSAKICIEIALEADMSYLELYL